MTDFHGSLNLKKVNSETTVMSIGVSGTATFAGAAFTDQVSFAGGTATVDSAGTATFVVTRDSNGFTGLMVARVTIGILNTAAAPAVLKFGTNIDVIDFKVDIEEPFDTAAGATAANIVVSAANGLLLASISVSASGHYSIPQAAGGNGTAFRNVATTIEAHVSIQGSDSTMSTGQGVLTVLYIGR